MSRIALLGPCRAWLAAIALGVGSLAATARIGAQSIRPLAYTRTVLPNGLVVLLNEDHTSPVVAVDVWYHIGAKDETPGHRSLAHLCEHLMGQGSPDEPIEPKIFIAALGGRSSNWALTTEDITHYFTTIPRNQLETVLWLESDRMAFPLTRADAAHLGSVRDVIRQERAQREESRVFGFAEPLITHEILAEPYQIDPVGDPADLDAATAAAAKEFCLPYYVPNNAVLSLSGDFNPAQAHAWIDKYFGPIPRRANPRHPAIVTPERPVARRIVLEDTKARGTQFRRVWAGASFSNPDRLALLALGSILSIDRTGRLTRALVYDRPLATQVYATNIDMEESGVFQIAVFLRSGASMTAIEQVVDSVITDVREHGVTAAELEPYQRSNAVQAITTLQSRESRADTLAHGEIFAHDPIAYARQVDSAFTLTPADVQRAARQYLGPGGVVVSLVPAGKLDLIARPALPFKNVTPHAATAKP